MDRRAGTNPTDSARSSSRGRWAETDTVSRGRWAHPLPPTHRWGKPHTRKNPINKPHVGSCGLELTEIKRLVGRLLAIIVHNLVAKAFTGLRFFFLAARTRGEQSGQSWRSPDNTVWTFRPPFREEVGNRRLPTRHGRSPFTGGF